VIGTLADIWLVFSVVTFGAMWIDCQKRPQHMAVMNVTWPLTALYFGPLAFPIYRVLGRRAVGHDHGHREHPHHHGGSPGGGSMWRSTFVGTTHCGGGCALGDLIGEVLVARVGLVLGGSALLTSCVVDFVIAYGLGLMFQYWSIRPMHTEMTRGQAFLAAARADTVSILAFEIGMFAIMGVRASVAPDLGPSDAFYWVWMQCAMVVGFATSFPANWVLVKIGVKEAM